MLGSILNAINIKKEVPDAIGYRCHGPIGFPIPEGFVSCPREDGAVSLAELNILFFELDNHEPKMLSNIRILYSGDFQYEPQISYTSRNVEVESEVREKKKEIYIGELPPKVSISICFFDVSEDFKVDVVLIDNHMITSAMNRLANFKSQPSLKWVYLILFLVVAFSFASSFYSFHAINEQSEVNKIMNELYTGLGYVMCKPELFDNAVGNEKMLERKYLQLSKAQQENILFLNSVITYEDLKLKEKVMFCSHE